MANSVEELLEETEALFQEIFEELEKKTGVPAKNWEKMLRHEEDEREKDQSSLKPCPFRGEPYDVYIGKSTDPAAFWDSRMRGSEYWYIRCTNCDVIMKGQSPDELIKQWNTRGKTAEEYQGEWDI